MICLPRSAVQSRPVYHKAVALTQALMLDTSAAAATLSAWNGTAPTSSVFSLGTGITNSNLVDYAMLLIASVPGFSKVGSFTGNGSADGPYQDCGIDVEFLLTKRIDNASGWAIYDRKRDPYNPVSAYLGPESTAAESAVTVADFTANGFKIRTSSPAFNGAAGVTAYWAIGNPFKHARAR
jgi:hypothetical protein